MIKLPYTPPFNWQAMLDFLRVRATPGVEKVTHDTYTRSVSIAGQQGIIEARQHAKSCVLNIRVEGIHRTHYSLVRQKLCRVFDLAADPALICVALKRDKTLWPLVRKNPGLRVPGCWDGFEIAVRAIVGQQISVVAATTVMGNIAQQYGDSMPAGAALDTIFPAPHVLAELDISALPMPKARAETIARVARATLAGELDFNAVQQTDDIIRQLLRIKGIGPWTAHYIAMRALAQSDALLQGDLVLEKNAAKLYGCGDRMKTAELLDHAETWRPYRAYAAMHIWNAV